MKIIDEGEGGTRRSMEHLNQICKYKDRQKTWLFRMKDCKQTNCMQNYTKGKS